MVFNSFRFAVFFLIIYLFYLSLDRKRQNWLLLAASYVFYSFWDWRFLSLIIASTAFNYYCGLKIEASRKESSRRNFLVLDICLNLAMLGFFKYFNFFTENLRFILWNMGLRFDTFTLNIILPLGISFYTFKVMSYPIDIYRKVISPTKNILDFGLFVAFFPNLIAGPIDKAKDFLPQIAAKRVPTLDKFYQGSWLFFWGLFKKMVIADNLAKIAGAAGGAANFLTSGLSLIAMYAFTFQVYADFSGYSDIARGIARMMGFELTLNFRVPFFSKNLSDLWQRWHISLTNWIKDYVYYSLALARFAGRQLNPSLALILTWAIMGFWHGAAWKFVAWGVYHGILLVIYTRLRPYLNLIRLKNRAAAFFWRPVKILIVFNLFAIGLLFFAADSSRQVFLILQRIAADIISLQPLNAAALSASTFFIAPLVLMEYFQNRANDEMVVFRWPAAVRACVYFLIFYLMILFGDFSAQAYYYFQF